VLRPSQSRAIGSTCLLAGPALLSRYQSIREFDETLGDVTLVVSCALAAAGLYLFVYQSLRKRRRPPRAARPGG
jgi:hypothetical protein